MKFVLEVDLSGDMDNSSNFKKIVPDFVQDAFDMIPNGVLISECLSDSTNGVQTFDNGVKALVLSSVKKGPPGGKEEDAAVVVQVMVTNQPFHVVERAEQTRSSKKQVYDIEMERTARH